jgi:hypothetical protein
MWALSGRAGGQLWADDLLLMTSYENADTAKLQV